MKDRPRQKLLVCQVQTNFFAIRWEVIPDLFLPRNRGEGGQKVTAPWHGSSLRPRFASLLACCCGLMSAGAGAPEPLLPPTFQPGFEYVMRSQQTLETMLAAGLPNAGKQVADVTFELVASCRNHPQTADHRDISIRLEKVRMNVDMGGIRLTYDSSLPDSGETLLGQTFKGVMGKTFQITLDPEDQVVELKGLEEIGAVRSPLGQQIGVEQLTQVAMPMLTLGVPKEGVTPGQTWRHLKDVSMGPVGKLHADHAVTYAGEEAGIAELRYQAELRLAAGNGGGEKNPKSPVTIEKGNLSGILRVDKAKRFPVSGAGEGSLTMTMMNPADPAQTLQLPITQRRTFELVSMSPLK